MASLPWPWGSLGFSPQDSILKLMELHLLKMLLVCARLVIHNSFLLWVVWRSHHFLLVPLPLSINMWVIPPSTSLSNYVGGIHVRMNILTYKHITCVTTFFKHQISMCWVLTQSYWGFFMTFYERSHILKWISLFAEIWKFLCELHKCLYAIFTQKAYSVRAHLT